MVRETLHKLQLYGGLTMTLAPEHYEMADSLCVLWDLTKDTSMVWQSVRRLTHLSDSDRIDIATFVLYYIYEGVRPNVTNPAVSA